jgi:hypothetical protein
VPVRAAQAVSSTRCSRQGFAVLPAATQQKLKPKESE